jgi:phosphomannomutase
VRLEALHEAVTLQDDVWIVATTWPTSRSIGEVAESVTRQGTAKLATFRVPVGFKHFAALVSDLEDQIAAGNADCAAVDVTGERTAFGARPRLLIMAEESGGAAMGSAEPVTSRAGARTSLAPKEKDAMQIGVLALCLAARLHREQRSWAGYYLDLLDEHAVTWRFYERRDITLFDESLKGEAREEARRLGNQRKERTVAWFAGLEGLDPEEVRAALNDALPEGVAAPEVLRCFRAGDGTMIEMKGQWFELRASGTDAVLRFYMEGDDADRVSSLNQALAGMDVAAS